MRHKIILKSDEVGTFVWEPPQRFTDLIFEESDQSVALLPTEIKSGAEEGRGLFLEHIKQMICIQLMFVQQVTFIGMAMSKPIVIVDALYKNREFCVRQMTELNETASE